MGVGGVDGNGPPLLVISRDAGGPGHEVAAADTVLVHHAKIPFRLSCAGEVALLPDAGRNPCDHLEAPPGTPSPLAAIVRPVRRLGQKAFRCGGAT